VIDQPRTLALHEPRLATLARLVIAVTEAPYGLSQADHESANRGGLTDDEVMHAIALSAFFGHLNRIADAVAIPLDYDTVLQVPKADPSQPALRPAPATQVGRHALELTRRPATASALAQWRTYAFERDAPLTRRQRTLIARWVARWLGDGSISPPEDLTANPLDDALRELAEQITLAPWRLCDRSFDKLRDAGFDDVGLFDVCATTSSAGVFSRIEVALVTLAI
jgi:alkylhydroperoxidase family enzyme